MTALRLFLLWLLCLPLVLILPQAGTAQQRSIAQDVFKPDWLGRQEARYLQAGLTLEGLYLGLLDGEWGKGSQSALDRYLSARGQGTRAIVYGDLLPLVTATQATIQIEFWQGVNDFPKKATFLAPMALMQPDTTAEHFTLKSGDGSLLVRLIENDKDQTISMHQWLIDNHAGSTKELYRNYSDQRLITSGLLKSGKTVYLRSEYAKSNSIVTVLVQYEPFQKMRGQMIAASISYEGYGTAIGLPQGSAIGDLLNLNRETARPSEPVRPVFGSGGSGGDGAGGGGGISRPAPIMRPEHPPQGNQPAPPTGGGIGIARPAPGTGPSQPGIGAGGSGGGIARPAAPIAANSLSFAIPSLPPAE